MPYASREAQLAYNRAWAKRKRDTAAHSPLAETIMAALATCSVPATRAELLAEVQRTRTTVTASSLTVALNRMQAGGRVRSLGYSQWVIAE